MFYDYLLNRILVHFGPKPSVTQHISLTEEEDRFSLFLSKKDTYDNLTIKVAEHLSKVSKTTVDPSHVRFTTVNSQTNKPRTLVKKTPNATLATILQGVAGYNGYGYSNQAADALYYEVLEMSISDLEQRKTVKIIWLSDGIQKEVRIKVSMFFSISAYIPLGLLRDSRTKARHNWGCSSNSSKEGIVTRRDHRADTFPRGPFWKSQQAAQRSLSCYQYQ